MSADLIAELARLHHRATDLRAREAQLADAGENDPASDTWKTAAIVAASAECEFEAALVEAWPALARLLREADQWRARESETQEALQAIGEEFGVNGGEPRVDGIRRVLTEQRNTISRVLREAAEGWRPIETAPKQGEYLVYQPEHRAGRALLSARICFNDQTGAVRKNTHWRPLPTPPSETGK